jgi:WS/DGAT/MGAT family acyltransferase
MEALTPLATAFLDAEDEDPNCSLAIGALAVFEGPTPAFEDFVRAIEGRLPLLPRYRQKLRTVPFDLGPPVWADDPAFDVRWHIRNTALPSPGGREELNRLMARVMGARMDRGRPLWEYWFVEGLADGRWAFISKIHHSLVDGVSGSEIFRLVLDPTPEPRGALEDHWRPAAPPSALVMLTGSLWRLATVPVVGGRVVASSLRSPRDLVRRAARTVLGLATLSRAATPARGSSLVGPIGYARRYTSTSVSVDDIRTVRHTLGGTLNDVALAIVSGGFRELLLSRGEEPAGHTVRSLVPVSTRVPGTESVPDNQVSLMLPYLPVEVADPVERLHAVRERIAALRAEHEPEAGESVTTIAEYSPFTPVALGIRLAFHLPQRQIVTVTTNVPGPRVTLYGLGRKVEEFHPFVPIADRVRIGIAMFSYDGRLTFGITGDYDTVPDIEVLASGITSSMKDLLAAATHQPA